MNIRISPGLAKELDSIANSMHISKAEWVKYALAKAVETAKGEILDQADKAFVLDRMTAEEYKKVVGHIPLSWLVAEKRNARKAARKGLMK